MNDTFGGDFNSTQTAAGGDQKAEGIAPIVLKQLQDLPTGDNNFQMWGMTFAMVDCAVIVRSIEMSSTKITYLLEDHTGRIEAHYWLEDDDQLKAPDIMLNCYAKVYGSIRNQGGEKTLMLFKIQPIQDPNEVTTHLLEVLNARYKAEQYMKQDCDGSNDQNNKNPINTGFGSHSYESGSNMGLDSKQLAVFKAVKEHISEEGISRKELERKFAHMKGELSATLDFMVSEGHIYSTIDSDHFRSTE